MLDLGSEKFENVNIDISASNDKMNLKKRSAKLLRGG
jgi:hypothetical protein